MISPCLWPMKCLSPVRRGSGGWTQFTAIPVCELERGLTFWRLLPSHGQTGSDCSEQAVTRFDPLLIECNGDFATVMPSGSVAVQLDTILIPERQLSRSKHAMFHRSHGPQSGKTPGAHGGPLVPSRRLHDTQILRSRLQSQRCFSPHRSFHACGLGPGGRFSSGL
jgi:hypothetical protein